VRRVLVANRGEIALRAIRASRKSGLESVAVYSSADANSAHRWAADEAICIGPPPPKASYLNAAALIEIASNRGCDAIYPGYGFLSENSEFAARCAEAGLTFIGPHAETIFRMGDKVAARQTAASLGIPVVPSSTDGFTAADKAEGHAKQIGFPLLLKASGGGGKGMRVVANAEEFASRFDQAKAEAQAAFGNPAIYLERFFPQVRHVEIQVFGDTHGDYVHLGERDCSVQRRHQKLVEEAPSPAIHQTTRREMAEAALALVRALNYVNAGTVEFICDVWSGKFFFVVEICGEYGRHPPMSRRRATYSVWRRQAAGVGGRIDWMTAPMWE
jgi:acetyl-CoA carboxylase biotin carboxylase subunit